jgi:hypothetical protein
MVREMNKISLYEAIRRKKEAEGLNMSPQAQPIPQQKPSTEPRISLKPSPAGARPVVPAKPFSKIASKPLATLKGQTLRKPKAPSRVMIVLRDLLNDKMLLKWAGIAVVAVVVIVVVSSLIAKALKKTDVVIEPPSSHKFEEPIDRDEVVRNYTTPKKAIEKPVEIQKPAVTAKVEAPAPLKPVEPVVKPQLPAVVQSQLQKKPELAKPTSTGDNAIVIAAYTKKNDLLPVQEYFKKNGIETEIIQDGSYYYVISRDRFDTVNKSGSAGYQLKQKIKQVGANYKAPAGFERFASKPFQDVYGKKISK